MISLEYGWKVYDDIYELSRDLAELKKLVRKLDERLRMIEDSLDDRDRRDTQEAVRPR